MASSLFKKELVLSDLIFCICVHVCMHECTKECAYVWRTKDNHGYHSSGFFRNPPFIYLSGQSFSLVWNSLSWWGWLSNELYWCPSLHIPSTDNTSHLQRFWSSCSGPHACKHEPSWTISLALCSICVCSIVYECSLCVVCVVFLCSTCIHV